ncbi:MAG TPA: endonuclease [Anaerolineae bacterium]|nr:endonuclease [Anaerolineae bacterium]
MSQQQVCHWEKEVASNLPQLSRCQARILAWLSYGIVMARSCGRKTVATFLGLLLDLKVANVEQRLREWCLASEDKAGKKRQEVVVETCFGPLLAWILRLWSGNQLALTLDATNLNDRFVVLAVSVCYRGIGIPVAWRILPAGQKKQWRREWLRLLRLLWRTVPKEMHVIVLADRGLYGGWLYRRIQRLGWHPFLRINSGGSFRPQEQTRWQAIAKLVPPVGHSWLKQGSAFKTKAARITNCTLLIWWGEGYEDPWIIITDLHPNACDPAWYGLRTWCEQGFKCNKRGGWQWQYTQMTDPARAERIWLALALAMFWTVTIATPLDLPPEQLPLAMSDTPLLHWQALLPTTPKRPLRLMRLGWIILLVSAVSQKPLPFPTLLLPEPWPSLSLHEALS